ncbi:MAG: rRNA maturation RNase YbeY [Saprospiraceae bacterium]|nr:rRNA maturation RNase YbeY [Saprospiraceae bacterium]
MKEEKIFFHRLEVECELNESAIQEWIIKQIHDFNQYIEEINFVLCSDEYILQINRDHLHHDYYTDIITFPYQIDPIVADIYISIERVRENALLYEVKEEHELLRVIIHGILHILGFEDSSENQKSEMREMEDKSIDLYYKMYDNKSI